MFEKSIRDSLPGTNAIHQNKTFPNIHVHDIIYIVQRLGKFPLRSKH